MTGSWERAVGWTACMVAVVLLVAALIGARVDAAPVLRADDAVVRLATVPGRPAAGYLTLSGGPATLTSVVSPLASRIEMHASSMTGGVMRMDALPAVVVPATGTVHFAPGGNHLMIYDLPASVKPGASVPLLLHFERGRTLKVVARAVAPGAMAAGGTPMSHGSR